MITSGTWKARGCEADLGHTSTGNEQVGVDFVLLEGPDVGKHITWYGYFTEKTTDRTLDSLRYCGWQSDNLADLSGIDVNEVYIVIEDEPDQDGMLHSKVRWVNQLGGVQLKERMGPGDATAFAQRMRGAVLAHRQAAAASTPAPRTGARTGGNAGGSSRHQAPAGATHSVPPDDDDIPF